MPPLGSFGKSRGFVPDFSVLIMFDEFIIPGQAYERIRSLPRESWAGTWPEVIDLLDAEGALSTVDIEEQTKQVASIRGGMLRKDMRDPARWASAMMYYDNLMATADRALGQGPSSVGSLDWRFDPEMIPGVRGSDGHNHILSAAPLTDPGEDPDDPHFELHQVALDHLRGQLREVNAGLAMAARLDVAPMFWAPYKGYLEAKSDEATRARSAEERAEAARLFFRIAFPRYGPETVRELSQLRRDGRLRQLRQVIQSASKTGEVMDPEYPQRVLEDVLRVERKVGRERQIMAWISSAIGLIPFPGVGFAATGGSELVTFAVERRARKNWNWFYLISDGTGHS